MFLSKEKIHALLKMLVLTNESEQDCDYCLSRMAEFAETTLAGKTVPEALKSIEHHLTICGECCEEFEALKQALALDSNG